LLTLVERILVIAELPLFTGVGTSDLASLATVAREWEAQSGEIVHAEGDASDALHVVIAGAVKLERPGVVARCETGRAFGAWGLFDSAPRRFTATADGAARLLSIEREAFVDVISDHVNVSRGILRVLAGRLRRHAIEGAPASPQDEVEIG
jgi:CRP/FNR family cyclic AMP-dependent transcriptional regulator